MRETFWTNIIDHPYHLSTDEHDLQALMLYKSEQQKQWFLTVKSPAYAYDLSIINEEVLRNAKECMCTMILDREEKRRVAELAETLVSHYHNQCRLHCTDRTSLPFFLNKIKILYLPLDAC